MKHPEGNSPSTEQRDASTEKKAIPIHAQRGIMIAFLGTDGSGKSTIINGLYENISSVFSAEQISYYHCRPFLLQPSKAARGFNMSASCPNPHQGKSYGMCVSVFKLLFCTADYLVGYFFRIRRELAHGKLVVFDRYYYDFYMDKQRYRMSLKDWWFRRLEPFIPKPDITFVLSGDAELIWQRKKEMPPEEVRRQIRRLEKHCEHFANVKCVNVIRPIPEVVDEVWHTVLEVWGKR